MSIAQAYAKGTVPFMGLEIGVAPGALVPRIETELLGRTAAATLETLKVPAPRLIDMCCGAGNLACALAVRFPLAQVWASDVMDSCVALARENVRRLGLEERVQVAQGDLFGAFAGWGLESSLDLIVCNPPYISQKRLAGESAALLDYEPREAFDGGPYGLTIHQRVIRESVVFLKPAGWLLFEVGLGQAEQVKLLFGRSRVFADMRLVADAHGAPRVVTARRKAP